MLRTLVYLLLTIVCITFLRAIVGLVGKAVGQLFQPTPSGTSSEKPCPSGVTGQGGLSE